MSYVKDMITASSRQYLNDASGMPLGYIMHEANGDIRGFTKEGHNVGYVRNGYTYKIDGSPVGPGDLLMTLIVK